MLVWWCCSFLRQLRTSLETPTHGHGMKTDMAEPSVFRRSAVPAEAIGTRTRTVPQTLHGTAIYADQARGGGLGGLFGAAYIAVPWSVWGKKKTPVERFVGRCGRCDRFPDTTDTTENTKSAGRSERRPTPPKPSVLARRFLGGPASVIWNFIRTRLFIDTPPCGSGSW